MFTSTTDHPRVPSLRKPHRYVINLWNNFFKCNSAAGFLFCEVRRQVEVQVLLDGSLKSYGSWL